MRCDTTDDARTFWELTSGFLLADPVLTSVLITNVAARRDGAVADPAPATYAAVLDGDGRVVGAAMRTPPHPIYVSPMPPEAMESLAAGLAAACPDAAGVTGTAAEAAAFAAAWARLTGASHEIEMHQRIYRLDAVTMPAPPPGRWRPATAAERDLLVEWSDAFGVEAMSAAPGRAGHDVDARLAGDRAFLWVDGGPVSYVGAAAPAGGVVRIGPVYTPPERRGRGYASALVAAVSRRALDSGATACSLYTDQANPTSNKVYIAVGYRPVSEVTALRFTRSGTR